MIARSFFIPYYSIHIEWEYPRNRAHFDIVDKNEAD